MHEKKLGVTMLLFQQYEVTDHIGVNFLYVCCHSNKFLATETNII